MSILDLDCKSSFIKVGSEWHVGVSVNPAYANSHMWDSKNNVPVIDINRRWEICECIQKEIENLPIEKLTYMRPFACIKKIINKYTFGTTAYWKTQKIPFICSYDELRVEQIVSKGFINVPLFEVRLIKRGKY